MKFINQHKRLWLIIITLTMLSMVFLPIISLFTG